MLNLIIARHGNTFDKGDIVRRVGLRTNIPLSNSGIEQAKQLSTCFHQLNLNFDVIYCSELIRTYQTAMLATEYQQNRPEIIQSPTLNEVDYGIDDGQPEEAVVTRIGAEAIKAWETQYTVPKGWLININDLKLKINQFVSNLEQNKTYLVVTSNGIARFFSQLLSPEHRTQTVQDNKMPTGSFSWLTYDHSSWHCIHWGIKPSKIMPPNA